jgi:Fur family transcriptional regulator, ferric uptake regulator
VSAPAERQTAERQTAGRGLRATRQRAAVSRLLDRLDGFRSAQEIHEELRRDGKGVGLTTVYRTLQNLSESGEVDMLRTDSGEAVYRRCSTHHHHHLMCRRCGNTAEVEGPAVESWARRIAEEHGYSDVSHTVEVFGVCPNCREASQQDTAQGPPGS